MRNLRFAISEGRRREITRQERATIRRLYEDLAADFGRMARNSNLHGDAVDMMYIRSMARLLEEGAADVGARIESDIRSNVSQMASQVVRENADVWGGYGIDLHRSIFILPTDIVETIVSGQLYQSDWSLSQSIWGSNRKIHRDIQNVVAACVAANMSSQETAEMLERYVDPSAATPSRVIRWTDSAGRQQTFYFGNVDYNAQRLARTMVSHAYQEAFVRVTRKNPFITKYRWDASNSRPCPICQDRDGKLFKKDELPLDHPNGMCTFEAVIDMSDEEINSAINNWYRSAPGTYPELDAYASDLKI